MRSLNYSKNKIENYKIVSDIQVELSRKLNIEDLQKILADYWSSYMENTNCVLQDATCFESYLRYPTDVKLVWESCNWIYKQLTNLCEKFKIKKPRFKFKKQSIKQLTYDRKRKKTYKKTQKCIRSLLFY